jgi:histidine ammonia-lyase
VQDAYSLRCMPQVHGAAREALGFAISILERELGSVTDNPLVFAADGGVLSGGNFHGDILGLAADTLTLGLTQLAGISERRIDRLVNPLTSEGLPPFLASGGGVHSGYMIAQYVAAALVSELRTLAHPASVDSIPTSGLQEDYNAMGAGARCSGSSCCWRPRPSTVARPSRRAGEARLLAPRCDDKSRRSTPTATSRPIWTPRWRSAWTAAC